MEKKILEEPKMIRYGNSEEAYTWALIRDFHKFLKERGEFSSFIKTHEQYDKKLLNDKGKCFNFLCTGLYRLPDIKGITFSDIKTWDGFFKESNDTTIPNFYSNTLTRRFALRLLLYTSERGEIGDHYKELADEFIIEELRKKCKKVYPNELQFSVWFGTAFTILGMLLILFFMGWIFGIETSMVISTLILTLSIIFYFQIK